jgi:hypothetical protein
MNLQGSRRRSLLLLAGLTSALGFVMLFGAAERGVADTVSGCAGGGLGKPLCVAITDQENATPTTGSTVRYLTDSVTVSNGGTSSNLVNLVLSATWTDTNLSPGAQYEPTFSSSECTLSPPPATNTITCTTPKSVGPGASFTYNLVFRTGSLLSGNPPPAGSTKLEVTVSAKEQSPPKKTGGTNVAFVKQSNTTPYEVNADLDISAAGDGIGGQDGVTLATSSNGAQSSKLNVPSNGPRGVYLLSEENYPSGFCPTDLSCFGQHVTVVATGLAPVNLRITYNGPNISGLTEGNLVVVHLRDGETTPTRIATDCGGAVGSGEPAGFSEETFPNGCRRVHIDHLSSGNELVEIDAWDIHNGGFGGAH